MQRDNRAYARFAMILFIALSLSACAKPLVSATSTDLPPMERSFSASANEVYYAVRWAMAVRGYPVGFEDLRGGVITSSWVPTRADSHYIQPFTSTTPDYGTTMMQQQYEIRVMPAGGETTVSVTSRVKSLVANPRSSGREERALLDEMAHYLRSRDVELTNIGVE
ncbi:MAG: hypothetical protein HY696_09830 [Deltaproteobacteria bacterium]|nr:hypothetical protein [Deltaproteobacteria bacterium]